MTPPPVQPHLLSAVRGRWSVVRHPSSTALSPQRPVAQSLGRASLSAVALGLIRLYRVLVSPLFPPACRFWPTCSRYSEQAISRHGVLRGGWLTVRRLARCHPFHPGGYDPLDSPDRS